MKRTTRRNGKQKPTGGGDFWNLRLYIVDETSPIRGCSAQPAEGL
jgi:hypothetical protein